jgi:hypothetical protein
MHLKTKPSPLKVIQIPSPTSPHKPFPNQISPIKQEKRKEENMGTSFLLCIYHASRFVVARYGSHDGYPSRAGLSIMEWISPAFVSGLRRKLAFIRYRIPRSYEDDYTDDNLGVAILADIIRANDTIEHSFALNFAHDGTFCEWTYVIDLDSKVLEVYYGNSCGTRRDEPGRVLRGMLAEIDCWQMRWKVAIPFIEMPGDKEELVEACTAGMGDGEEY